MNGLVESPGTLDLGALWPAYHDMFSSARVELYHLVDRYAATIAHKLAVETGLIARLERADTLDRALQDLGIVPAARALARRTVQVLCDYRQGERLPDGRWRLLSDARVSNLAKLRAKCLDREPDLEPALAMLDRLGTTGPEFFLGHLPDVNVRADVHQRFFTECPLGLDPSRWGGAVVRQIVQSAAVPCRILELGGGTMSGATGVLDALEEAELSSKVESYQFTELNPFFVMTAKRCLPERYPKVGAFEFRALDFSKAFSGDIIDRESVDIVYSTNAIQCARDLRATMAEVCACLKPGGMMVTSQYFPFSDDDVLPTVDLVCDPLASYWDVEIDPVLRPVHGMLCPERWIGLSRASGFAEAAWAPAVDAGRKLFGERYFIGASVFRRPAAR